MASTLVALGLGANLGDCEATLRWALEELAGTVEGLRAGDLYRSAPEGGLPGPAYWNTAAVGTARLDPEALLACAKALELAAGRRPGPRDAPRPLDIDLLLYGEVVRATPELTLPHPRLRRRAFVLAPLADVSPGLAVPPDGTTVAELLARVDREGLERVGWSTLKPAP